MNENISFKKYVYLVEFWFAFLKNLFPLPLSPYPKMLILLSNDLFCHLFCPLPSCLFFFLSQLALIHKIIPPDYRFAINNFFLQKENANKNQIHHNKNRSEQLLIYFNCFILPMGATSYLKQNIIKRTSRRETPASTVCIYVVLRQLLFTRLKGS